MLRAAALRDRCGLTLAGLDPFDGGVGGSCFVGVEEEVEREECRFPVLKLFSLATEARSPTPSLPMSAWLGGTLSHEAPFAGRWLLDFFFGMAGDFEPPLPPPPPPPFPPPAPDPTPCLCPAPNDWLTFFSRAGLSLCTFSPGLCEIFGDLGATFGFELPLELAAFASNSANRSFTSDISTCTLALPYKHMDPSTTEGKASTAVYLCKRRRDADG